MWKYLKELWPWGRGERRHPGTPPRSRDKPPPRTSVAGTNKWLVDTIMGLTNEPGQTLFLKELNASALIVGPDVASALGFADIEAAFGVFRMVAEGAVTLAANDQARGVDLLFRPSVLLLHQVVRAKLLLDTYFADLPGSLRQLRRSLDDIGSTLENLLTNGAGARIRPTLLLQPPPEGAEVRYLTSAEFRRVDRIREKVLAREKEGGEFVIDLYTVGVSSPHGNVALTVILFNPSDWV